MEPEVLHIRKQHVSEMMREHYQMWEQMGYGKIAADEMEQISQAALTGLYESLARMGAGKSVLENEVRLTECLDSYAAACQCYYLYRSLHHKTDTDTRTAVLLGDYFFGQFSHYLIPVDSPRLIDIFSEQLQRETKRNVNEGQANWNLGDYAAFVAQIPGQFAEELV